MRCLFASDLHGRADRYEKLAAAVDAEAPDALFLGGDLLPPFGGLEFVQSVLAPFAGSRRSLSRIFLIPGNDDPRMCEEAFLQGEAEGLWMYLAARSVAAGPHRVYGYPYVPPTPFHLKDWERYDVSHYVDPGCVAPEDGSFSVATDPRECRYATIASDLARLTGEDDLSSAILLFHSPPYRTALDRAALDGKSVDHAPLDVNVGSIAVRRLIEQRQPLVSLHGHVHESARLTGKWLDRIGRTVLLGAAHDGPELALISFDTEAPENATRALL